MVGQIRKITFVEGVIVEGPNFAPVDSDSMSSYADDAAFVTAKGSAADEGDFYKNTTDGLIHYYDADDGWQIVDQLMPTNTIRGNNTGGTAREQNLNTSQVRSMLGVIQNPMTTLGDIIIGTTLGAAIRLAGDTTNVRKFLRSLSAAGVATQPVWDVIGNADIPSTLTGKTLVEPIIDNFLDMNEEAEPATPPAGVVRIFPKNDKKVYKKTSDGLVQEIGSGSGGGSKNYIAIQLANDGAEANTNGWGTFNTTFSGGLPGAITAGSTKVNLNRVTTNILRGAGSFELDCVDVASSIGHGIISDVMTIDDEDLAKYLEWAFSYYFTANSTNVDLSGTSTQTLELWIYNVGLGVWDQPRGHRSINTSGLRSIAAARIHVYNELQNNFVCVDFEISIF